ncbi:hypothetical protein KNE206_05260 [Kitasatospora sp. NE20-6]|uniref:hypothetical protein n=1 Tax=Kitasatospora sp. NE20-6 TaxID=2859066 RepID=UPI0034DCB98D
MARKPRPVDPADGPIPAFAHALRNVREDAGNPTYRALAVLAGFSATTLSDAAGGVRQPSLEVTLAYVGACGGDVPGWERRWRELDAVLVQERAAAAGSAGSGADGRVAKGAHPVRPAPRDEPPAEAGPTVEPTESAERTEPAEPAEPSEPARPGAPGAAPAQVPELPPPTEDLTAGPGVTVPAWARWSALAAALAVVVLAGVFAVRHAGADGAPDIAASTPAAPPECFPDSPAGVFSGTTYNVSTQIRAGASISAPVLRRARNTCSLQLTGYCLGDVVVDITAGTPDIRWFQVEGGGVVSSAVVHGNPPGGMQPSACPDSVPAPTAVALSAVRPGGSDSVELRARGTQVAIVGFAAYFAPPGASDMTPTWQQIGLTDTAALGFATPWRIGPLQAKAAPGATVPVVAAACLGGGGPTAVVDARLLPLSTESGTGAGTGTGAGGSGGGAALPLAAVPPGTDLVKAAHAACRYPMRG